MGISNVAELSAQQRLEEVAAIFAEGILRLRRTLGAEPKVAAQTAENLVAACLENSGETGLNVTCRGTASPQKASRRGAYNTTPALTITTLPKKGHVMASSHSSGAADCAVTRARHRCRSPADAAHDRQ